MRSNIGITPMAAHTMYWVAKTNPYASISELSRAAGVVESTLSYWLRQGRKRPDTVYARFRDSLLKAGWCEDRPVRRNTLARHPELVDAIVSAGAGNPRAAVGELAEAIGETRSKVQHWLDRGRRRPNTPEGDLCRRLEKAGWLGVRIGSRMDVPRVADAVAQVAQDNPYASHRELGAAVGVCKAAVDHWMLVAQRKPDSAFGDLRRKLEAVGWLGYDPVARRIFLEERGYRQYLAQCIPCAGGCGLAQYKHPKGRNWMCDRCQRRTA